MTSSDISSTSESSSSFSNTSTNLGRCNLRLSELVSYSKNIFNFKNPNFS